MKSAKRLLLTCVVFIACVGCDQTTKSIANSLLPEGKVWSYQVDVADVAITIGGLILFWEAFGSPGRKTPV